MSLTGKQQAFVNAYLGKAKFNATQAARLAGYSGNDNVLAQMGHKLVRNGKISLAIEARLKESAMSADENLMHIGEIARGVIRPSFFFVREVVTEQGENGNEIKTVKTTGELDWNKLDKYGHLVKSISFTANGPKIELHDRLRALELIGKHHRLFTDKHEVTGEDGAPIKVIRLASDDLDWDSDDK